MPPEKLTPKRFWDRVTTMERLAELHGAKFPDDTPARRIERMAEAVVLPEAFNQHYLPHYFRDNPASFHLELYRALEKSRRTVVRAPRGHAKSTVITFAYTLHQVACGAVLRGWKDGTLTASNPELHAAISAVIGREAERRGEEPGLWWDPYIQIVSVTEPQAAEFTEAIKLELQSNELLRSDWGELLDANDRQAAGDWVANDVRVRAFGMMGNIRGGKHRQFRPTLLLVDDPDSEETVGTRRQRDRQTRKIVAAATYGLEPKVSRIFVMGTPIDADCQVCRLTAPERYKRWLKLRYRAIQADGTALWPERWSIEALREEEEDDPEAFAMEMMDLPPSSGRPFETTHYYSRAALGGMDLPKTLAFDPSLGRTATADYQALVVLRGPTPEGWYAVHRVELLRIGDPLALMRRVDEIVAEEQPDLCVMETIGFQSLLLALGSLNALGTTVWVRIDSQENSKDLRIRGFASKWNAGEVRLPDDKSCRALEHQALDYPQGKKDGLDAAEMAYRQGRRSKRSERREVRHHARRGFGRAARREGRRHGARRAA